MKSEYVHPDSPGFLLWQTTNLWQKNLRNALQGLDLTHVQFVLLASASCLQEESASEDITQNQIAQHAQIDPMMASQVLRTLERKGLLLRSVHPTDTRAKTIALTALGQQIITQALGIVEKTEQLFFSRLDHELETFVRLMKKMNLNDETWK